MSRSVENQKKNQVRMPLFVKITLLFLAAGIAGSLLVFFISRDFRMKRAIEQGGEASYNACLMAEQMFVSIDPYFYILKDEPQDAFDESIRNELRYKYFIPICNTFKLKYLYLFTVDEDNVRHHIISVAGDPEEDDYLREYADFGTTNDDPLDENEIAALDNNIDDDPYYVVQNSYGYVCSCIIPVIDNDGNVVALIGADCDMSAILNVYNKNYLLLYVLLGMFLIIMLIISAVLLHFAVLKPARTLSITMRRFADDPETEIQKRKVHFKDEISDMEHSFRVMAGNIRNYLHNIEKLTKDKVQADVQLEDARRIQQGMVPPELKIKESNFSFSAEMQPALEVGGDFYDAFRLADGRFAFLIGDVSGKGISAALFMAMTKRVLRDKLLALGAPAIALTEANKDIYNENPEGFFATVFAVIYDPVTGKIVYSNAGHTDPLFYGGKNEILKVETGGMLGIFDDTEFKEYERTLEVGDGIFLYTDGTTEAVNTEKEAFGEERLLKLFEDKDTDPVHIVNKVKEEVISFEGDAGLFDDLTMLAFSRILKYRQGDRIELKPLLSELPRLKKLIFDLVPVEEKAREIMVVAEEWMVNLVSYSGTSYISTEAEYKMVSYEDGKEEMSFVLRFEDDGTAFDPVKYQSPEKEFEDFEFGGMGIGIIKDKTKLLTYERKNEHNIIDMYFVR